MGLRGGTWRISLENVVSIRLLCHSFGPTSSGSQSPLTHLGSNWIQQGWPTEPHSTPHNHNPQSQLHGNVTKNDAFQLHFIVAWSVSPDKPDLICFPFPWQNLSFWHTCLKHPIPQHMKGIAASELTRLINEISLICAPTSIF